MKVVAATTVSLPLRSPPVKHSALKPLTATSLVEQGVDLRLVADIATRWTKLFFGDCDHPD